jgi:hypothetical protein
MMGLKCLYSLVEPNKVRYLYNYYHFKLQAYEYIQFIFWGSSDKSEIFRML